MRQRRTKAAGSGFQLIQVLFGQGAGPYRVVGQNLFQKLLQRKNLGFGNKHAVLAEAARGLSAAAVMRYRLTLNLQFKAEWCAATLGPTVKGRFADAFDDLRGLPNVVKAFAGLLVDVGRR